MSSMPDWLNFSHDAGLRSWVASANAPDCDFPIQNLPVGVFRRAGSQEGFCPGVAIGDQIIDLLAARDAGLSPLDVGASLNGCERGELNAFMAQGRAVRVALRHALSRSLLKGSAQQAALQPLLLAQAGAEYAVPCRINDYTDFYTGIHHATAVGKLFRPDAPLLPNYKWVPIGYHGRSSSIGVSGQAFARPRGQTKGPNEAVPLLRPSHRLDYELELGVFVGQRSPCLIWTPKATGRAAGQIDVLLEVLIQTQAMRDARALPQRLSQSSSWAPTGRSPR